MNEKDPSNITNYYINHFDGQLGNQLMAYNNLCQLAGSSANCYITTESEIPKFFKNVKTFRGKVKGIEYNSHTIRNKTFQYTNNSNIILTPPYLGELFFFLTKENPRNFLELKDDFKIEINNNKTNVAIHLRMPTNTSTNPYKRFKHEYHRNNDYYIKSIELCLKEFDNCNFIIFGAPSSEHFSIQKEREIYRTMDNFPVYQNLIEFLNKKGVCWEKSITLCDPRKTYIYDFSQMCECDVIVGTPSTFNTSATFLGKMNKKVIYLEEFINVAAQHNDLFWVDLKNGGNEYYNIWKYI